MEKEKRMSPRAAKNPEGESPRPARKPAAAAKKPTTTTTRKRTMKAVPALPEVSAEEIALRAYMISISGDGGDQLENWLRAERELTQIAA
jgi:hypothetical protein